VLFEDFEIHKICLAKYSCCFAQRSQIEEIPLQESGMLFQGLDDK
jgi:hypothetical protein